MPLAVAVFLVVAGLLFEFLFVPQNGVIEGRGGLGTLAIIPSAQGAEIDNNAALNVQSASSFALADRGNTESDPGMVNVSYDASEGMVQDVGATFATSNNRSEVVNYIIKKDDTLSSIASYFGISTETILAANPGVQSTGIKSGETIKIQTPIEVSTYKIVEIS